MPTDDLSSSLYNSSSYTLTYGIKSVNSNGVIDTGTPLLTTTETGTGLVYDGKWAITTDGFDTYTISPPIWHVSGFSCGTEEESEEQTELVLKTRRKRIKLNFKL